MTMGKQFTALGWALLLLMALGSASPCAEINNMTVRGVGYPPSKTRNRVQALHMARRSAVLNAYHNTLTSLAREQGVPEKENAKLKLSGFIRGFKLVDEQYFSDGAVTITGRIDKGFATLDQSPLTTERRTGTAPTLSPEPNGGSVSLEQWYRIIEKMVTFEPQ